MSLQRANEADEVFTSDDLKDDELFKVSYVAKLFDVAPATVRKWIRDGKLKALKMPGQRGQIRIQRRELKRFASHKFDIPAKEAP